MRQGHQLFSPRDVLVSETPDRELITAGGRKAMGELLRRYQGPVFRAAFRIVGNVEDAADVTQAAFLKAFEKRDDYDPEYRFFSWLYRIALNEAVSHARREARRRRLEAPEPGAPAEPPAVAEQERVVNGVQASLMSLNEDHRLVIVLKHFSGFSYREIAEILQLPEKTVKSRLYTARQVLKDRLNGKELI